MCHAMCWADPCYLYAGSSCPDLLKSLSAGNILGTATGLSIATARLGQECSRVPASLPFERTAAEGPVAVRRRAVAPCSGRAGTTSSSRRVST